jgi:hypothetical protein
MKLKWPIPKLEDVKARNIQHICKARLGLPSRKKAGKTLLINSMKLPRLEFARQYKNWGNEGVEESYVFDGATSPPHICLSSAATPKANGLLQRVYLGVS